MGHIVETLISLRSRFAANRHSSDYLVAVCLALFLSRLRHDNTDIYFYFPFHFWHGHHGPAHIWLSVCLSVCFFVAKYVVDVVIVAEGVFANILRSEEEISKNEINNRKR